MSHELSGLSPDGVSIAWNGAGWFAEDDVRCALHAPLTHGGQVLARFWLMMVLGRDRSAVHFECDDDDPAPSGSRRRLRPWSHRMPTPGTEDGRNAAPTNAANSACRHRRGIRSRPARFSRRIGRNRELERASLDMAPRARSAARQARRECREPIMRAAAAFPEQASPQQDEVARTLRIKPACADPAADGPTALSAHVAVEPGELRRARAKPVVGAGPCARSAQTGPCLRKCCGGRSGPLPAGLLVARPPGSVPGGTAADGWSATCADTHQEASRRCNRQQTLATRKDGGRAGSGQFPQAPRGRVRRCWSRKKRRRKTAGSPGRHPAADRRCRRPAQPSIR